jgi:predicted RNA-binding Zn-ribbon protein involved in translation (DUF1610 family)
MIGDDETTTDEAEQEAPEKGKAKKTTYAPGTCTHCGMTGLDTDEGQRAHGTNYACPACAGAAAQEG